MGALSGQVALVTGAGSPTGIGHAVAARLGRLGARVAVTSTTERILDRAADLGRAGIEAWGGIADLTDRGAVGELVAGVHERFGPVGILVNNAGMTQSGAPEPSGIPFTEMTGEVWDRQLAISLTTAFNATHAVVTDMLGEGHGRILFVSSVTGPVASFAGQSAYAAAKAGLDGLMRTLAVELGPMGITANSVAPGWIATGSSEPHEQRAAEFTPVGRPGTPDEVAALVAFLAGPDAGYVNGQSLVVDGGNIVQEDHAHGR
ncbi:MAG TPA: SDR family oxidoreductase [Solirubrobacteraceae bacterium]|nr:SDR family oxidoreductase [Solirubrobacteraceae bacterium]